MSLWLDAPMRLKSSYAKRLTTLWAGLSSPIGGAMGPVVSAVTPWRSNLRCKLVDAKPAQTA